MKKNKFIIFIVILIFYSCQKENTRLKQYQNFEKITKRQIFNNFPINKNNFGEPYFISVVYPTISKRRYSGLFITYQINKKAYRDSLNLYSQLFKNHDINIEGNNFVIPDSLLKAETKFNFKRPAIPNSKDSISHLHLIENNKTDFLIISSKEGEFLKNPYDVSEKSYLSQGYSSGLMLDEINHYITYWILVW